ncbi:MAG: hypothetical protein WDO15_01175 [Bacteroidota bacterium]
MVRAKITKLINSRLEGKYFHFNDFHIKVDDSGYRTVIKIIYEYDAQYELEIIIPNQKSTFTRQETNALGVGTRTVEVFDYEIEGKMCPGKLAFREEFKNRGASGINEALDLWLINLWEDITISPENRIFLAQKEEIEKLKERIGEMPDEYFTVEEGNNIRERLEKIESQLADKLINEVPDETESKKQIEKLHQEIEILKQTIHSLKKSGWFKSFVTKTMSWLSNPSNQKLLKAGKEILTKMLPENGETVQ